MAGSGHVKKMARRGEAGRGGAPHHVPMQSRYVSGLTLRPLAHGDTETVAAVWARLDGGAACPSDAELAALARVDATRHVLVAYLDGDPAPVGIGRLMREGRVGDLAVVVADAYPGRGIGSVLTRELAADARAAGITELVETACGPDGQPASALAGSQRNRDRPYATSWTASTPGS